VLWSLSKFGKFFFLSLSYIYIHFYKNNNKYKNNFFNLILYNIYVYLINLFINFFFFYYYYLFIYLIKYIAKKAIADSANPMRKDNEQIFHTKNKS